MKKLILSLLLAGFTLPSMGLADDKHYTMCEIAGYYEGDENRFLHGLAMRVVEKNHLTIDHACYLAMKAGKDVALKFAKPGKAKTEEDSRIMDQAAHFSNTVYDAILFRVKFD